MNVVTQSPAGKSLARSVQSIGNIAGT
jgi:hypothetical protein